jgi:hypothetical protein
MKKLLYIILFMCMFSVGGQIVYGEDIPWLSNNQGQGLPGEVFSKNTAGNEAVVAELEGAIVKTEVEKKQQAVAFDNKEQKSDSVAGQVVKTTFVEGTSCIGAQVLGTAIAAAISSTITTVVGKAVEALTLVPTNEQGQSLLNSNTQAAARVGTPIGIFGITGVKLPSWDSIAYCVVNSMITYVANSTIAWVQGGFQGNPSFINNPEQFFTDLANIEAGAFLKELAYGTAGLNICEPFRAQIVLSIARNHLGGQQAYGGGGGYSQGGFGGGGVRLGYGGCTLDDIKGNLEGFLSGDFQQGGWNSWFKISQVDSNNPYATYFNLSAQLDGSINKKKTLAEKELNWGKGFLSFRKCTGKTPKHLESGCPITTPGAVIEGQLQKTLGISKDRLVLAEKFDQVIAAVVNQLIQTALDKVLDTVTQ